MTSFQPSSTSPSSGQLPRIIRSSPPLRHLQQPPSTEFVQKPQRYTKGVWVEKKNFNPNSNQNTNQNVISEQVNVGGEEKEYFEDASKNFFTETDKETGLRLVHFLNCDNNSSLETKQNRGVIFDSKNNVVCRSFSFTDQYLVSETTKLNQIFSSSFNNWRFYDSHEGTMVRLFFYNGKPHLSTHKKLDAFESSWGSKDTFGEMFINFLRDNYPPNPVSPVGQVLSDEQILENFSHGLDQNSVYLFLVCHTNENRMVCKREDKQMCYHVGTFTRNDKGIFDVKENVKVYLFNDFKQQHHLTHEFASAHEGSEFPTPQEHKFKNLSEMTSYVSKVDPFSIQGILARNGDIGVKIVNETYNSYYQVRDNVASLKFRYLQLRSRSDMCSKLKELYPERVADFNRYEKELTDLTLIIYNAYFSRYINKKRVFVPQYQFFVMGECHSWHLQDKKNNKISIDKVRDVINSKDAPFLINLLRSLHLSGQKQNQNQQRS